MSKTQILVVYDGEAVREGTMDVRDLAPALFAIGELCQRANKIANGDESEISVRVKAEFQPGSFGIDLQVVQGIIAQATNLLLNVNYKTAKDIIALLFGSDGLISLYRRLKGKKLKSITRLENGNFRIDIQGDGDNSIEINHHVYQMYNDERSKKAMDGITHPLRSRREIDTFEVRSEDEQVLERIDRQEAEVFYSINQEEESTSNSPETQLIPDYKRPAAPQILKLSFKDGNKWVFSDGSGGTINADITDNSFWEKLNNRELSFGKGDTLKVEMLTKTSEKGGKLHTVHTITKVEKIIPPEQLKLFPQ